MEYFESSNFKVSEFREGQTPEGLIVVLKRDGFKVQENEDTIASLNSLLRDPSISDKLLELGKENLLTLEAAKILRSRIFKENASWPLKPEEIKVIIQANYPQVAPGSLS